MKALVAAGALAAAGCASQEIVSREYYEPKSGTTTERADGLKVGALKSETVRSGSPDWSGHKSFSLIGL